MTISTALRVVSFASIMSASAAPAPAVTFFNNLTSFNSAVQSTAFGFNSLTSGSGVVSYSNSLGLSLNGFTFAGTTGNPASPYYLAAAGPNFYFNDYNRAAPNSSLEGPAVSSAFYGITKGVLTITMPPGGVFAFGVQLWSVQTNDTTGAGSDTVVMSAGGSSGTVITPSLTGTAFLAFVSSTPVTTVTITGTAADEFPTISQIYYSATPAQAPPVITGVVSASAFGGFSTVAPGSWVEIYGSNLSATTRGWGATDFAGNNAPTSLDGVQVTMGGQKAFVDYISSTPGQVNAQLPSSLGLGPLQLTVTNSKGVSAPFPISVNALQPGLLAPGSFKIGGSQYVVAQLPDGNYVLPVGAIAGVNSRPAMPGETIVIYGVGFGAVLPNIAAGQIVTQSNQLAAPLEVLFGQTPAQVLYAGLAPGFVGLYQFNIVVPAVPDNNLVPLTFNLGGTPGTQVLYTAVHQ